MTTATEIETVWRAPAVRSRPQGRRRANVEPGEAPVVAAVDTSSAAQTAVMDAVRLARDLNAPLVFVYFRRGPSAALGEPYYQRRLNAEMAIGNSALEAALAVAKEAGVAAGGEQLHGNPARRLAEFARIRRARLVVVGSRRRLVGRSVSRAVLRKSDRPVVVAGRTGAAPA